ncbi:unnamed protein product [Tilletia caries]|uniref:Uncharacterized protein n=1 Tax=Tilletia caries TaxID=13290 RepID=A0ABN7JA99_9BASI|nr:unnamed protein product [Tilletia caries]
MDHNEDLLQDAPRHELTNLATQQKHVKYLHVLAHVSERSVDHVKERDID